jgi:hypothetical protein
MTQTLRPYQQRDVAEIGANFAGAARQILPVPSALEVFRARAHLVAAGKLELHEAVDVLQGCCGAWWSGDIDWPRRGAGHDG